MEKGNPAQCINVISTSQTSENLSRYALLNWINSTSPVKVKSVESLCSGYIYCYYLDQLFPGCICLKKVKQNGTQEHEHIQNLKQLQSAFYKIGCDQNVPISRLAKGRFQDNFEFLQWFKKFFDINYSMQHGKDSKEQSSYKVTTGNANDTFDVNESVTEKEIHPITPNRNAVRRNSKLSPTNVQSSYTPRQAAEKGLAKHEHAKHKPDIRECKAEIQDLHAIREALETERDCYFNKLRQIENLCIGTSASLGNPDTEALAWDVQTLKEKVLEVLYHVEEGFQQPTKDDSQCYE